MSVGYRPISPDTFISQIKEVTENVAKMRATAKETTSRPSSSRISAPIPPMSPSFPTPFDHSMPLNSHMLPSPSRKVPVPPLGLSTPGGLAGMLSTMNHSGDSGPGTGRSMINTARLAQLVSPSKQAILPQWFEKKQQQIEERAGMTDFFVSAKDWGRQLRDLFHIPATAFSTLSPQPRAPSASTAGPVRSTLMSPPHHSVAPHARILPSGASSSPPRRLPQFGSGVDSPLFEGIPDGVRRSHGIPPASPNPPRRPANVETRQALKPSRMHMIAASPASPGSAGGDYDHFDQEYGQSPQHAPSFSGPPHHADGDGSGGLTGSRASNGRSELHARLQALEEESQREMEMLSSTLRASSRTLEQIDQEEEQMDHADRRRDMHRSGSMRMMMHEEHALGHSLASSSGLMHSSSTFQSSGGLSSSLDSHRSPPPLLPLRGGPASSSNASVPPLCFSASQTHPSHSSDRTLPSSTTATMSMMRGGEDVDEDGCSGSATSGSRRPSAANSAASSARDPPGASLQSSLGHLQSSLRRLDPSHAAASSSSSSRPSLAPSVSATPALLQARSGVGRSGVPGEGSHVSDWLRAIPSISKSPLDDLVVDADDRRRIASLAGQQPQQQQQQHRHAVMSDSADTCAADLLERRLQRKPLSFPLVQPDHASASGLQRSLGMPAGFEELRLGGVRGSMGPLSPSFQTHLRAGKHQQADDDEDWDQGEEDGRGRGVDDREGAHLSSSLVSRGRPVVPPMGVAAAWASLQSAQRAGSNPHAHHHHHHGGGGHYEENDVEDDPLASGRLSASSSAADYLESLEQRASQKSLQGSRASSSNWSQAHTLSLGGRASRDSHTGVGRFAAALEEVEEMEDRGVFALPPQRMARR